MEKASPLREGEKNCSGSSAIISYQPIQTTSPTAWSVPACVRVGVCVCVGGEQRASERQRESTTERERERERAGKGGGSIFFHLPPVKPQEGGARP